MHIKVIKLLLYIITLAVAIASPALPAYATPADPDSISLPTAKAFENIYETGDMLFVITYDVAYVSEPTEDVQDTFLVNLLSTDGTTLLLSRQLEAYQYNTISLYASADDVTALGLTWGSNYKLRVTGNPAVFASLVEGTNMRTKTLSSSDWNEDGTLTSDELLALHIIDIADTLETEWAITLLVTTASGDSVLNSTGRTTFLLAIPGIDTPLPGIFQSSSGIVTMDVVTANNTLQGNSTMTIRLGPDIAAAFSGIGTWLGISQSMAGGLWALLFLLTIASIAFLDSGNSVGALICVVPIGIGLTYVGAIPVALLFTIGILLIAYTGYFLILRGI